MPKEITHLMNATAAAERCLKRHKRWQPILQRHSQAYLFGSIAPDVLYYDVGNVAKKLRGIPWADVMHGSEAEDNFAHLVAMQKILNEPEFAGLLKRRPLTQDEKEMLTAFALGYLTHAALDIEVHPIVYYYSGNPRTGREIDRKQSETRHRAIETVLDLYLLGEAGKGIPDFNVTKQVSLPAAERDLVLAFPALSLRLSYGSDAQPLATRSTLLAAPASIRDDKIFRTFRRSYRRHLVATRVFRWRSLSRLIFAINSIFRDRISTYSTLFYPASSYKKYLKAHPALTISQITSYRDPYSGNSKQINQAYITLRVLARCRRMMGAYLDFVEGEQSLAQLSLALPSCSLDNGLPKTAVSEMKFSSPLAINGSFA